MVPATAIAAARSLAGALVEDGLFDGPMMRQVFEEWLETGDPSGGLEGYLLERKLLAPRVLRAVLRAQGWGPQSSSAELEALGTADAPLGLSETADGSREWADQAGTWPTTGEPIGVPPGGRWGEAARAEAGAEEAPTATPVQTVAPTLPGPGLPGSEAPTRRLPKQQPAPRTRKTFKEPRVGQVLGGYELVNELGRGGMGIVFEARRDGDPRRYAVKVLKPSDSPAFARHRERFKREIELLRPLKHRNLIRIRARGWAGEYDWYAMDHVAGTDLHRLSMEQELSHERKLAIFEDICRGAAEAHERGVVHRDLKPQNVIVSEDDGHAVLIDFGLAKLAESDDPRLTRSGSLLGTPYYMSPEQVRNPHAVDSRSDVWSLGVMLYELLTGEVPFPGAVPGDVCQRILHGEPVRPRKLNPQVSPDLEGVLLRALEKDPARRHANARQLLADLGRYRLGTSVSHDGVRGRMRRWLSRHREGFLVGVLVASAAWAGAWAATHNLY